MAENEKQFEENIEAFLISPAGGYRKADDSGYCSPESRGMALDISTLVAFVKTTQPVSWQRFEKQCNSDPKRKFYQAFATDSLYQAEHLNDVISFKGPDPDNDLKDLVGEISADEWEEMGPGELPRDMIYNIIYGQTYEHSNQKIFLLRGISNGQEMELTFRRKDGEWKLVKISE